MNLQKKPREKHFPFKHVGVPGSKDPKPSISYFIFQTHMDKGGIR